MLVTEGLNGRAILTSEYPGTRFVCRGLIFSNGRYDVIAETYEGNLKILSYASVTFIDNESERIIEASYKNYEY